MHFLLYTGLGSLILVLAGIMLVAVVVWSVVATVVTVTAWALWVAHERRRTRSPSPPAAARVRTSSGRPSTGPSGAPSFRPFDEQSGG